MADEIGFTPQQLSDAGFFADEIAAAASVLGMYSPSDMKGVDGMTVQLLKDNTFDANSVRAAGYSADEMASAGYDASAIAASAAFAPKDAATSSTTIVVIVVVVLILLVVGGAIFYVKKVQMEKESGEPVVAFENPMYDSVIKPKGVNLGSSGVAAFESSGYMDVPGASTDGGDEVAYMDINPAKNIGAMVDQAYMDVSPNAVPNAGGVDGYMEVPAATGTSTTSTFDTAGYMDVSPLEPGGAQSAEGYMDVSANSTFGFDAGNNSGEEI